MASYENLKNGKVRVHIRAGKKRQSKTFSNKVKARSWAIENEQKLSDTSSASIKEHITVGELFKKYAKEISPSKKSGHKEAKRLDYLQSFTQLSSIKLIDLSREDIEDWINLRLQTVQSSSVNRELNIISHCLTKARRWYLMEHNPFKDLERPKNNLPRFRRITTEEIEQLNIVMDYKDGITLQHKYQYVALAFHFAIETAMRAGEITQLTQDMINTQTHVAHLPANITKNSHPRAVPMSPKAISLLKQLPKQDNNHKPIFQLTADSLSTQFRKYRNKTTISDLHFHDTRHEAITRLAQVLDVLDLARAVGHRDIKQLMVYYNKSAEDIAQKLAEQS